VSGGSELVPLYYLAGIGTFVAVGVGGVRSYLSRQQAKWVAEGAKEANLAEKLDTNTKAADNNSLAIQDNTRAIAGLGVEFREFVQESRHRFNTVDERLATLDGRVGRVEESIWPAKATHPGG
jgi:hypothetical protein